MISWTTRLIMWARHGIVFSLAFQLTSSVSSCTSRALFIVRLLLALSVVVRSQAKDSRKAKVEQGEFDEELSEQEGRLSL
jgi:hypothetical protein